MRPLLTFLLLTTTLLAQNPEIQLDSTETAEPGQIILIDASATTGATHFRWTVVPEEINGQPTLIEVECGRKAILASYPGEYTVIVAAASETGLSIEKRVIVVSGGTITPDPRPVNKFGLAAKVKGWIADVPKRDKQAALRDAFVQAADRSTKISDLKKVEGEARDSLSSMLVREALGADAPQWMPLFDPLGTELGVLAEEGKVESLEDYQQVWREIAEGLR